MFQQLVSTVCLAGQRTFMPQAYAKAQREKELREIRANLRLTDPFGYKPSTTPVTTESRYSRDDIDRFVASHTHFEKDDAFAQANAEITCQAYADCISRMPPYRQILLIDGDRPSGEKRYLRIGETPNLEGRGHINGIYESWADFASVRIQQENNDGSLTLRPIADIQGSISHELSHQQDEQLYKSYDSHRPAWSYRNMRWENAIQQEHNDGNTDRALQALVPEQKIVLHEPYFQHPYEAKAEFERLFDLVYAKKDGDFEAAAGFMNKAYPHMWPVFHDEYMTDAMKVAAQLNPHIDLHAIPVGYDAQPSLPALRMAQAIPASHTIAAP